MKLFFSIVIFTIISFSGIAQTFPSLYEDFDVSCATVTWANYPPYWSGYCNYTPKSALEWNCSPLGGRFGTPGFDCNSYISGVYYVDTAWLFTPKLNLSGNTDKIFIRYDSKYEFTAAKMAVLVSHDYVPGNVRPDTSGTDWTEIGSTATPVIGHDDSLEWVTHFVELTPYKATPLYVAFKYMAGAFSGGRWTIDNVMTTPWGLSVKDLSNVKLPISVLGAATSNQINISCTFNLAGAYKLSLTDLMGREVYAENLHVASGTHSTTLEGLNLAKGMYFLKISNTYTYGATKVMVD